MTLMRNLSINRPTLSKKARALCARSATASTRRKTSSVSSVITPSVSIARRTICEPRSLMVKPWSCPACNRGARSTTRWNWFRLSAQPRFRSSTTSLPRMSVSENRSHLSGAQGPAVRTPSEDLDVAARDEPSAPAASRLVSSVVILSMRRLAKFRERKRSYCTIWTRVSPSAPAVLHPSTKFQVAITCHATDAMRSGAGSAEGSQRTTRVISVRVQFSAVLACKTSPNPLFFGYCYS